MHPRSFGAAIVLIYSFLHTVMSLFVIMVVTVTCARRKRREHQIIRRWEPPYKIPPLHNIISDFEVSPGKPNKKQSKSEIGIDVDLDGLLEGAGGRGGGEVEVNTQSFGTVGKPSTAPGEDNKNAPNGNGSDKKKTPETSDAEAIGVHGTPVKMDTTTSTPENDGNCIVKAATGGDNEKKDACTQKTTGDGSDKKSPSQLQFPGKKS